MPDELPPVPPDLQAALEAAVETVKGDADASRRLEFLLDALIIRGQLPDRFKKIIQRIQADRGPKIRLSIYPNKHEVESPPVPCLELIPLCGARCCSFDVALSEEDVLEKKLPFVIDQPYMLPRDKVTKRCTCMADNGGCTVYEIRPGTCRAYDCREDRRVWIDYEARIPAPLPENIADAPVPK